MTKTRSLSSLICFCALAFVLVAVSGCEDDTDSSPPVITSPFYPGLSPIEPPAPKYEDVPVIESPMTELWKPGYWSYNGTDFDWVSGEVIARPSPTAVWAPTYWAHREYGWAFVPGDWE